VKIPIEEYSREMLQRVLREADNLQDFRQLWIENKKRRDLINYLVAWQHINKQAYLFRFV
jgi:type I restriction enzyme R subunit